MVVVAKARGALTAAWLTVTMALGGCGGQSLLVLDVTSTLAGDDRFEELSRALEATGLDLTFADPAQNFTVFAPTDDAFATLGAEVLATLTEDPELLRDLLLYHVVADAELDGAAILATAGGRLITANGDEIVVNFRAGELFVNDARLVVTNIQAANGVIHALDTVLVPGEPLPQTNTVAEVVAADPRLTVLNDYLQLTGLSSAFEDQLGAFTLFAPSDAAFAALPAETAQLFADDVGALVSLLLHHFIANQALDAETLAAFEGDALQLEDGGSALISFADEVLTIGGAEITVTNIAAGNGVIHIIDAVLLP